MRKGAILLAQVTVAGMLLCGCQSVVFSPQVDGLLAKMRKAYDPKGTLANATTKTISGTFRTDTKSTPMRMTLRFKRPDKLRVDVDLPNGKFIKAFDGKTAWSFAPKTGLKVLKGTALDGTHLQALLLSPGMKLSNIFESIKLVGTETVGGKSCYKLICQPKKMFNSKPMTYYVDKDTMLVVERVEELRTVDGKTSSAKTFFNRYEPADGVMVARNIITYVNGDVAEYNVDSVVWDSPMDDSLFTKPNKM